MNGKTCDFPFKYKGTTYSQCTKDFSANGKPWCANAVDPTTGEMIEEKWGDCEDNCQGGFWLF